MRRGIATTLTVTALLLAAPCVVSAQDATPQFRSRATVVPIDVRVLDKNGRPVTDLTAADFRIFEDGRPQVLSQFLKQMHVADPEIARLPPARRRTAEFDSSASARRVFALVLGEGRLQKPSGAIDDTIRFVKTLLPQDLVGVAAYNRWSDFSSDHAATIRLLERFKVRHEIIETARDHERDGLRQRYGDRDIRADIQKQIDTIFDQGDGRGIRELAPPTSVRLIDPPGRSSRFTEGRFSDALHLFAAIDYLRLLEGEKHVMALCEQGTPIGPRLASVAADARVALHIIQTGGLGDRLSNARVPRASTAGVAIPPGISDLSMWAHAAAREIAEQTGGLTSWYSNTWKALERIEAATRTQYLVGYSPQNQELDGALRRVTVEVNRPGVTVLYRHQYHAASNVETFADRAEMAEMRMTAARDARTPTPGLNLNIVAIRRPDTAPAAQPRLEIEVAIEPSQVHFTTSEGRHAASLDVAIWVTDATGRTIGHFADSAVLNLDAATFARLVRDSIVYTGRVPLSGTPAMVKVVVYDYDSDRVGSVQARVPAALAKRRQ